MAMQNGIQKTLTGHELVPVVTFNNANDAPAFIEYLINQNIGCIEVTLRTKAGLKAIELIKKEFNNSFLVGAGTVTHPAQLEKLVKYNADFVVSPGLTSDLLMEMESSKLPYLPGVSTPSEIMRAREQNIKTLKFFPANLFGGIDALKAYGQLFPDVDFCPTGGITKS
ncbi:MAG: 2-dehydro-3-deoxyphosphogluconate aldolase/(4S)-4-hydroxy-2-oxoglutarate aldolase, partial [Dokdonia sp.]